MSGKIRTIAAVTVLAFILWSLASVYLFGVAGGTLNAFSPNNEVQIESDTVGDVVTVAGNRNQITQPAPEPAPNRQGKVSGIAIIGAFVVVLLIGIYIIYRITPIEVKTNG